MKYDIILAGVGGQGVLSLSALIAWSAMQEGLSYPVALNAANETAVSAFLDRRIAFSGISRVVGEILERHSPAACRSLDDILAVDGLTRKKAEEYIKRNS